MDRVKRGATATAVALLTAAVSALVAALLVTPTPASAAVAASAGGTAWVGSATWSVIPTSSTTGTPSAGALTLTYSLGLLGPSGPQYFDVVNTGTHALVSTDYTLNLSVSGLLSLGSTSVTLTSCSTTWNTSANTCGGTTTLIGTFSGGSSSIDSTDAPLASASRVHIQATVSTSILQVATLTVVANTSVSSASPRDVSAATTTNQ